MKGQFRINQIFAFVVLDDDGTEGVPALQLPDGTMMPLMGADVTRLDDLKAIVQQTPQCRGRKFTILRFGNRETIGTIDRTHEPRS